MLPDTAVAKVTAAHLSRRALLYVRQSSLKQVIRNTESAIRQYDLRGKAVALGWDASQVTVIDIDQGQSGSSAADREGFQQMVAEVSLGRAGIVLGLECSRLARNNADWHQLLEICAMTGTLICDEDGLYDPRNFNDRLLLGMKGQMSEAELHFTRARLRGGQLSKARRGELVMPLPIGLVCDAAGHVVLDPDAAIQGAVRHLLATFEATGSATAVVKAFRAAGLSFPWRHHKGPRKGEVDWQPLRHSTVLHILHNPRYAGAFTYGRHREQLLPGGKRTSVKVPCAQWISFIPGAHPGYITLDQWEANTARLAANAAAHGRDRAAGPPREGPALLQGIIMCGRCGGRMTIRYHARGGKDLPTYLCQRDGIDNARPICAAIPGHTLDEHAGQLLIDTLTPARKDRISQLVTDLPGIWHDPATPMRERKSIARLLLTDVTVTRTSDTITAHARLAGGQHRTLTLPVPEPAWKIRQTKASTIAEIDQLPDHHTCAEIAAILRRRGLPNGEGRPFNPTMVQRVVRTYQLPSRRQRLLDAGLIPLSQMADQLGVSTGTVKIWHHAGIVSGQRHNDKGETLYNPPGSNPPARHQGRRHDTLQPA